MSCSRCDVVSTVPWSEFLPNVLIYARFCPTDVAEHMVREAAIELCDKVSLLQRDLFVDTQRNVGDYELMLNDDYVILSIAEVVMNGRPMASVRSPDMNHYGYFFAPPCSILIAPLPDTDCKEALTVRAVVAPSRKSCGIDAFVYDKYAETIAMGALSRIMLMKDSGWYDKTQAGIMLRRWKIAMAGVKSQIFKNFSTGPTFIKAPRWL